MNLYIFNATWMAFNIYLAILPVIFSLFLFKPSHRLIGIISGFFWFLYLPNTIYVFTDLHHLIEQWTLVDNVGKIILIAQYSILEVVGLSCYLFAFYPVEILINKLTALRKYHTLMLIMINMAFGLIMSLGKFERVNSWDVFVNPAFLLSSLFHFLTSWELVGLGILFGLFANFFYFLFRECARAIYIKFL